MRKVNIKLDKMEILKNAIKIYLLFIMDILLLWWILKYIGWLGFNELDSSSLLTLIAPIFVRYCYYCYFYKMDSVYYSHYSKPSPSSLDFLYSDHSNYLKSLDSYYSFDYAEKKSSIKNFLVVLLLFVNFSLYILYAIIEKNDILARTQILIVFLMTVIAAIVILFLKKDRLNKIDSSLNLLFIMSFSYFIIANDYFNLKNILFGISSYEKLTDKVENINMWICMLFMFFVTFPLKRDFVYPYGFCFKYLIIFSTISLIIFHIFENSLDNNVNYELIAYYISLMLFSIITITLVTEKFEKRDKKYLIIAFKIFLSLYVLFPNVIIVIILFPIIVFSIFKMEIISNKISYLLIFIIALSIIHTEIISMKNNIYVENDYSSVIIIISCLIGISIFNKKNKNKNSHIKKPFNIILKLKINTVKNQISKKTFFLFSKDFFSLFLIKKIHDSVKIKNEKVYRRYLFLDFGRLVYFSIFCIFIIYEYLVFDFEGEFSLIDSVANLYIKNDFEDYKGFDFFIYFFNNIEILKYVNTIFNNYISYILFFLLFVVYMFFNSFVYFTNKRVLVMYPLSLKYKIYEYKDLSIKTAFNTKFLYDRNISICKIKGKILGDYIENKIKTKKLDNEISSV